VIAFTTAMAAKGLLGGAMIGGASAALLLGAGRIAGVSGLAARALGVSAHGDRLFALAFVLGLPAGASLSNLAGWMDAPRLPGAVHLLVGGLLVGFGAALGSGCTSGHGVCGVARLSKRSLVATATFMATGLATVALLRVANLAW
jgi:uncharacterized membrane protein YedE/YeeE